MTREYLNLKRRRSWPLERRLSDLERRRRQRAHLDRYVQNPISQDDTHGMALEEAKIIAYLRAVGSGWAKLWTALNDMAKGENERERRPRRQALLALVNRMITEKKLVRHRPSNSISLVRWLKYPHEQQLDDTHS